MISKDTYYKCEDREDKFKEKYKGLKKKIEKILKDNSFYGVKRIKAELLQKYNVEISRDVLGKLLKLWGLSLKRNIRKNKPSMIKKIILLLSDKVNIMIRSSIAKPFQAISSDITEVRFKNGKFYLCVHKDVIGQVIYGFSVSQTMDTVLVKTSLNLAVSRLKKLLKIKKIKKIEI